MHVSKLLIGLFLLGSGVLNSSLANGYLTDSGDTILLKNGSNRVIFINYHNEFIWGNPTVLQPGKEYKIFPDSCCDDPLVLINSDINENPYVVSKTDKRIELGLDQNSNLVLSSENSKMHNLEINYCEKLFLTTGPLKRLFYLNKKNSLVREVSDIDTYKLRVKLLSNALMKTEISKEYYNTYKTILTCYLLNNLMLPNTIFNDHYKLLDSVASSLFSGGIIQIFQYKQALMDYYNFMIRRTKGKDQEYVLKNYFNVDSRNFILAKLLYDKIKLSKKVNKIEVDNFFSECTNSYYKKIITNLIDDYHYESQVQTRGTYVYSVGGNRLNLDSVFTSQSAKIFLLDFWASWCIPCRIEFKNTIPLLKTLKDSKVIYTFVSIDNDSKAWKQASINEGLEKYEYNYNIPSISKSKFLNDLKIQTIPRYILINSRGEILDGDFLRPSNPDFLNKLHLFQNKLN